MASNDLILLDLFYYFGSTALLIPIFRSIGLSSLFGYIASGIVLGPQVTGLLHHADNIHAISEIGIILLLFVIGLELSPGRINHLKKTILQYGFTQYAITSSIFMGLLSLFSSFSFSTNFVIANALTLSSTAIGLSYLKESDQLTKSYGQAAFGVLIFQDLIIIPVLAIIPLIAPKDGISNDVSIMSIAQTVSFILVFVTLSRFLLERIVNYVSSFKDREVLIGFCLMLVFGTSFLTEHFGLSKALGAFIAGMSLSGSKFKNEIHKFSLPLKSTLMGVFFMGIGLSFDINYFARNFHVVIIYGSILMAVKFSILFAIAKYLLKDFNSSLRFSLTLCQGGEFAFLILSPNLSKHIIDNNTTSLLLSIITFSMLSTPVILSVFDKVLEKSSLEQNTVDNVIQLEDIKEAKKESELKKAS